MLFRRLQLHTYDDQTARFEQKDVQWMQFAPVRVRRAA